MSNCKYKLRKLSIGLVSVGTMLMTTTVLGEENTTTTPTAEVTTENQNATSSEIEKEGSSNSKTDEVVEETPTSPPVSSSLATEPKGDEKEIFKTIIEDDESVISDQAEDTGTTSQATTPEKARLRDKRSVEELPQTMEVEKLQINKEKSEIRLVDGENGNKKLIANRDGKNREIADISREVKLNDAQDELEVTLKVTPKQIDEGASVIILLDTSKKMTEEYFKIAKENIKKLVKTLTPSNTQQNINCLNCSNRNTVRLINFYRTVNDPINLSGKSEDEVRKTLDNIWEKAKKDYNGWGVNLQGAIHRARQVFNSEDERLSGKRQHIILFSQGEATQSYEVKEKKNLKTLAVDEPVTYSNPLLPWPFYFDTTTRKVNLVEEGKKFQDFLKKLGIKRYDGLLDSLAQNGNSLLNLGRFVGIENPLNFITMSDLATEKLSEDSFDYTKKVGEGYHHRSYYDRVSGQVPLDSIVKNAVKLKIEKLKKESEKNSYDILGLSKWATSLSKVFGFDTLEEKMVNKFVDYLFYKRNYVYYNHNLSAQAEAKMARDEGILFHSFDVTMPNANNRYKRSGEKSEAEKRNEKFDKYLEEMSEGQKFFEDIENVEKLKDLLTEVELTDTFTDKVSVKEGSWKNKDVREDNKLVVQHKKATNSKFFFLSTATPESLTWTISKEKLKDAFEQRRPLELTYKLKVEKDKLKANNSMESITDTIITNTLSYKINDKQVNGKKLDEVKLTHTKQRIPVPEIIEEIVPIPHKPESSLVEPEVDSILPLIPLQPSLPIYPTPDLPEMEQPDQDSPEISGQSQIVDIVEDTLPGVSGQQSSSEETEITEDTRPESDNEIIIGGQSELVDIVEDTQSGMSGQHSSSEETEIKEDTRPESNNEIIVGGQSELVDIVEDTQPSLSGHQSESQETVTVEDTQPNQTNILIGGQSEIVDIIEDTQAGMTGQYSSTDQLTIVEDTLPEQMEETDEIKADSQVMDIPKVNDTNNDKGAKASVAFDVEESNVVSTQDIKPSTYVKGDNQLPQTGDDDNVNAFFTLAALSVIGAAGLRQNKRREKERN